MVRTLRHSRTPSYFNPRTTQNAIFGGFLAGLIMPRSHGTLFSQVVSARASLTRHVLTGFAAHLTEKLEDLISV